MAAATILTTADLDRALDDARHLGFGYATSRLLPAASRAALDRAVVAVANDAFLDYEGLFVWANSKYGRWLVDEVASYRRPHRQVVIDYLSAEIVAELKKKEA